MCSHGRQAAIACVQIKTKISDLNDKTKPVKTGFLENESIWVKI